MVVHQMTNTQLYVLIGLPVVLNFGIIRAFIMLLNSNINSPVYVTSRGDAGRIRRADFADRAPRRKR